MSLNCFKARKRRLPAFVVFAILFSGSAVYAQIKNPIGAGSFQELIEKVTAKLIPIAAVFAVLVIVVAGFKMINAALSGKAEELAQAKKLFWWVLIGTAVLVGAYAIASAVVEFAKTLQ